MKVRDVMEANPVQINLDDSYEQAARTLLLHGIGGAPVVDAKGWLVGVISEKDFFRILFPFYSSYYQQPEDYVDLETREWKIEEVRARPVRDFMSRDVVTIDPDAPIMRAGALMLAKQVSHLPVVERGRLVGLITRSRIYRTVLRQHLGA